MRKSTSIFVGLLMVFLGGWIVYVIVPYLQIGRLSPDLDETTGYQTPSQYAGWAEQGRVIYASNGCVTCHSQQVGSRKVVADIDRGWGGLEANSPPRRTVARDYLVDRAPYLGFSRLGPDLSNVGSRQKEEWLLQHLYEPEWLSPGSNCPPMHFLFDRRMVGGQPSTEGIKVPPMVKLPNRTEVLPRHDAKALVAYLLALKRSDYKLEEAPVESTDAATP